MKPTIVYGDDTTSYAFVRFLQMIKHHRCKNNYQPGQEIYLSPYYKKYIGLKSENELNANLALFRFKIQTTNTRIPSRCGTVFEIKSIDYDNEYVHVQADNQNFKLKFNSLISLEICDNTVPTQYVFTKNARSKKTAPAYVAQYDAKGQELQINQTVIYWDTYIEDYAVGKVTGFTQKYTAVYVETKAIFSASPYAHHTTKYPVTASRYKNHKTRITPKKLIVVDEDISDNILELILSA